MTSWQGKGNRWFYLHMLCRFCITFTAFIINIHPICWIFFEHTNFWVLGLELQWGKLFTMYVDKWQVGAINRSHQGPQTKAHKSRATDQEEEVVLVEERDAASGLLKVKKLISVHAHNLFPSTATAATACARSQCTPQAHGVHATTAGRRRRRRRKSHR